MAAVAALAWPQVSTNAQPDWRRIGNSAVELALASPASGPVERVWYGNDGARLYAQTASGQVFETADFEKWVQSAAVPPAKSEDASAARAPEDSSGIRASASDPLRLYAYGEQVLRSDDGGLSWTDLTTFERHSIIGAGMQDLAVSPRNADEVVVADEEGVWRSLDGGISWAGLNESLPNLPGRRIVSLPRGPQGVRLAADALGTIEWAPGEKQAWRTAPGETADPDAAARKSLSDTLKTEITALAPAGDFVYAGSADGRLWVSTDKGQTWNSSAPAERGPVESIWVDTEDPRLALAALGTNPRGATGSHVLRTVNAGRFWDDLTSDLPETAAHGITADRASGTIYVATDRGVYMTPAELNAAGQATPWTQLRGLPDVPALDVKLDSAGNQLFVAVEGYGVYAAMAPHRMLSPRLVNAADFSQRAAAPGSLLSVLGGKVSAARAGDLTFPVLAASDSESQIQVPFAAQGPSLPLALETGAGRRQIAIPIEEVSPAIFVDRDGTPLVLNADSGVLLDAMNTAHSNSRLQILATGLGKVRPDWPSGIAGPVDNPPQVIAPLRVYLDRAPLEVTRAVLAPGYVGLYLVEVQLPATMNAGASELYLESGNQQSNRVRIWVEP